MKTKTHCDTGHSRASPFFSFNQGNGHIADAAAVEAGPNGLHLQSSPSGTRQGQAVRKGQGRGGEGGQLTIESGITTQTNQEM